MSRRWPSVSLKTGRNGHIAAERGADAGTGTETVTVAKRKGERYIVIDRTETTVTMIVVMSMSLDILFVVAKDKYCAFGMRVQPDCILLSAVVGY